MLSVLEVAEGANGATLGSSLDLNLSALEGSDDVDASVMDRDRLLRKAAVAGSEFLRMGLRTEFVTKLLSPNG